LLVHLHCGIDRSIANGYVCPTHLTIGHYEKMALAGVDATGKNILELKHIDITPVFFGVTLKKNRSRQNSHDSSSL